MKSNSLLLTCDLLFRFLPFFLDTAIQIWNAVEVDRLATSCEARRWDYENQQMVNVTSNFMRNPADIQSKHYLDFRLFLL